MGELLRIAAECGRLYPAGRVRCDACQRPIRCVFREPTEGFLLGRRCAAKLAAFLVEARNG